MKQKLLHKYENKFLQIKYFNPAISLGNCLISNNQKINLKMILVFHGWQNFSNATRYVLFFVVPQTWHSKHSKQELCQPVSLGEHKPSLGSFPDINFLNSYCTAFFITKTGHTESRLSWAKSSNLTIMACNQDLL